MAVATFTSIWITLILLFSSANCDRILLVAVTYPSDVRTFIQMGNLLTDKGHNVTLVIPQYTPIDKDQTKRLDILTYISTAVQGPLDDEWKTGFVRSVLQGKMIKTLTYIYDDNKRMERTCTDLLQDAILYKTLEERKYDFAFIALKTCSAYLPFRLGVPYSQVHFTYEVSKWPSNHLFPKYEGIPYMDVLYASAIGICFDLLDLALYRTITDKELDAALDNFAHHSFRPYAIFISRHELTEFSYSKPPHVFYTGHMGRPTTKVLSQQMKQFVEEADHGVIVVAFGSWLEAPELMPIFLAAFNNLPYRVLIKSRSKQLNPVSKNVLILPWLPVTDLLAHNNTKLVIYHGGLNIMNEALYHGVPSIIIPFIFDQYYNGAVSESNGYGKMIHVKDISVDRLRKTVNDVINEEGATIRARNASAFIKEESVNGIDIIENSMKTVMEHGAIFNRDGPSHIINIDLYMLSINEILLTVLLSVFICITALWVFIFRACNGKIKTD